jgi:hypothetical protein
MIKYGRVSSVYELGYLLVRSLYMVNYNAVMVQINVRFRFMFDASLLEIDSA